MSNIPKKELLTKLGKIDLTKSKIISCLITDKNNTIISNKKGKYAFQQNITEIWKTMSYQKIKSESSYNITNEEEKTTKDWKYLPELKMWSQYKCANGAFEEIIKMCFINEYNFDINLELKSKKIVNFKHIFQNKFQVLKNENQELKNENQELKNKNDE